MKKFNRILAIVLVLALALTLAVPATAAAEPEFPLAQVLKMRREGKAHISHYALIYPYAQSLTATAVKGGSTLLQFKLSKKADSTDVIAVAIVRGSGESLDYIDESDIVEERYYKMSDVYNGSLGMTWKADSRYPVGEYTLIAALLNQEGELRYQYTYAVSLYVVDRDIPATGMEVMEFFYGDFEKFDFEVNLHEDLYLAFVQTPFANTSDDKISVTVEHPQILSASIDAGYVVLEGIGAGYTDITVTCGNVRKTYQIAVDRSGSGIRFTAEGVNTNLCAGMQDTIAITPTLGYSAPFVLDYASNNPDVVTVKDGVVTAVGPGITTVVVSCVDSKTLITYKVTAHELPEGTPVSERTATKPAMQVGHCNLCGQDDAVNIVEKAVFTDTDYKAWYSDHVDYVYDEGIMNGTGEHSFGPDMALSRAMVVTVLYRAAGSPEVSGEIPFTDVEAGQWYSDAILWASQNEVVKGVGDGSRFDPNGNITREQIATILYRYTDKLGVEMAEGADLNSYPDGAAVSGFAVDGMAWAVAEGLITGAVSNGVTTLNPQNTATRAQFATIISRYQQMFPADGE